MLFATIFMTFVAGARAEDAELRTLRNQVEELTVTVRQLQERVDALEKNDTARLIPVTIVPATAPATTTAPDGAAPNARASIDDKVVTLRNSWRRISAGMKQSDVKDALGAPAREMLINGKVVWYYHYAGLGAGSVFFNSDGRSSSSQPPNLGWNF